MESGIKWPSATEDAEADPQQLLGTVEQMLSFRRNDQFHHHGGRGVGMVVLRTAEVADTFQAAFQIPATRL